VANVRIITDSACDIPQDLADRLGIVIVPLSIRFGTDEYTDRADLSAEEFWAKCKASTTLPETAAPPPGLFQQAFEAARAEGCEGVVCITLSSDLSATYQSAKAAAESVSPFPVTVIDSRMVTVAQGLLAIDAAERAATGASYAEVVAQTRETVPRLGLVGVLDTLEHLKKGGRIGSAQALLGSMLAIKPLILVNDGKVAEGGRQRTRAKALDALAKVVADAAPFERLAVAHGAAEDLDALLARLSQLETDRPIIVSDIGPVVGTHGGPGVIGVCWIRRG
jgi:DegV family protein with EDD domain